MREDPRPGAGRMIERLAELLEPDGLLVRGGFHPGRGDRVPTLADDAPAGTLVLVGNAGPALWRRFVADADLAARAPLDRWLRPRIGRAAREAGADALVFPEDGPPYPPVQDWAMKADSVHRSPTGVLIHPEFGLWHVYRAALLFRERLELPEREERPSPCTACETRPCLPACPAGAFLPDRFDAEACVGHVESDDGENCRFRGCMARRACPVGREYRYVADQQAFHTAAMVRAARNVASRPTG